MIDLEAATWRRLSTLDPRLGRVLALARRLVDDGELPDRAYCDTKPFFDYLVGTCRGHAGQLDNRNRTRLDRELLAAINQPAPDLTDIDQAALHSQHNRDLAIAHYYDRIVSADTARRAA